jgi:conjugative transposon TraN protein
MKTIFVIAILFTTLTLKAQNCINVCKTKTAHLICPERVTYLQAGDNDRIIAEVVPEHQNIIRIKALSEFEGSSSLTAISGGKVYSIIVEYADTDEIAWRLENFAAEKAGQAAGTTLEDYLLRELSYQILGRDKSHACSKVKKNDVSFGLLNIFQKNDLLFFVVEIINNSGMGFDVENVHWWIGDKKQYKSTNLQEFQCYPVYQHYGVKYVPKKTTLREVFVFPKFTIPDQRVLKIELLEKAMENTGRKLTLEVKNKAILQACEF